MVGLIYKGLVLISDGVLEFAGGRSIPQRFNTEYEFFRFYDVLV